MQAKSGRQTLTELYLDANITLNTITEMCHRTYTKPASHCPLSTHYLQLNIIGILYQIRIPEAMGQVHYELHNRIIQITK